MWGCPIRYGTICLGLRTRCQSFRWLMKIHFFVKRGKDFEALSGDAPFQIKNDYLYPLG